MGIKYFVYLTLFTTCFLVCPIPRKFYWLKQLAAAGVVSAAVALACTGIFHQLIWSSISSEVTIQALNEKNGASGGTEVWITGVIVDDKFYAPNEIFSGAWIEEQGKLGWRNYQQPSGLKQEIQGEIPQGENRRILFEQNQWRGKANIKVEGKSKIIDFYIPEQKEGEQEFTVGPSSDVRCSSLQLKRYLFIISFMLCFAVFTALLIFDRRRRSHLPLPYANVQNREIWGDALRLVSLCAIVVIHSTGAPYMSYQESQSWYFALYVNAATRFAVPCFMMLSGAFMLSKRQNISDIFTKKIPKLIIPLLFWSVCYILASKYYHFQDISVGKKILEIPFQHQSNHLWFIYQLVQLSIMAPVLSALFRKTDLNMNPHVRQSQNTALYFVTISLFVPGLIDMLYRLAWPDKRSFLAVNWTYIGVAEVGLFVLGKVLLDYLKKGNRPWGWAVGCSLAGFGGTVLCSYIASVKTGKGYASFFEQIRFPVVLFACGIFMFFYLLNEKVFLKFHDQIRQMVGKLAQLCMGVYFIHILVKDVIGGLYPNPVLWIAMQIILSFSFCYVISYLPMLKKLVGIQ